MTLRRLTRPVRVATERARWLRGRLQHRAEVRAGSGMEARAERTPLFILGSPRSGTTLLYQLLTEAFDVGWLANVHADRPTDVVAVERRLRPRAARTSSDFESAHGATPQPWGPSEAGEFWYRFFPRHEHQVEQDDPQHASLRALRAVVRAFADACAAPVVFKNTINSLRVPAIAAALPEARFVLIERDLADNARSLLVGRQRRGDLDAWWSARPAAADREAGATPAEQVAWQARAVHDIAQHELQLHARDRWLHVTYDELCEDPRGLVERIDTWLRATGAPVERRRDARLPERFDRRGGGQLPPELERALAEAVERVGRPVREDRT